MLNTHNVILLLVVLVIAGCVVGFVERIPGLDATFALIIKCVAVILALLYVLRFFGLF